MEKPVAATLPEALDLARLADQAGLRHGVVQDKIFLPGLIKLQRLVDGGFFGRIVAVRGVQLAELGMASAREGRRMAVPELSL